MWNKRLRILHLYPYYNHSGPVVGIFDIVRELKDKYIFYTAGKKGTYSKYMDLQGIKHFDINIYNKDNKINILRYLMSFIKLAYICKKYRINIIHLHHRIFSPQAMLVSKIFRIKYIATVRTVSTNLKHLTFWPSINIAVSENVKCNLNNYFSVPKSKIITAINAISNPLKDSISFLNIRRKYGISDKDIIILNIGHVDKIKGVDILIKSFLLVKKKICNVYLFIIGDGDLLEYYKSKGLKNVFLLGSIDDVRPFYLEADLFVISSRKEGLPRSIIEASYFGIPIIATKVGGIPEVVEYTTICYLVQPGSVLDLTSKIMDSIKNLDKIERIAKRKREKAIRWNENNYKKLMNLYSFLYDGRKYL